MRGKWEGLIGGGFPKGVLLTSIGGRVRLGVRWIAPWGGRLPDGLGGMVGFGAGPGALPLSTWLYDLSNLLMLVETLNRSWWNCLFSGAVVSRALAVRSRF